MVSGQAKEWKLLAPSYRANMTALEMDGGMDWKQCCTQVLFSWAELTIDLGRLSKNPAILHFSGLAGGEMG